ncbi:hypothetical protein TYRP_021262 [Tyrophagus putrescentiae]|nr:hypothetical protein TYRP_021262 [Tyrophagus putrescentiae]
MCRSPVQAGGVADYRTNRAPEVRYEPVKTGGTADYRPTETASFTKGGGSGNRSSTSSKAKIVPSNRNHLNAKNNSSNSSGNNRRGSSSSNTSFSCKAKFGAVGNCIVGTLAFFFILILIVLALVFSDGSSSADDTSSPPKWNGVFNGTYVAENGSGRFSSKSASNSRSSMAFRFALAEHRLRIDRKTDRATGRTYYQFKSRPAETSSTEYLRQLTFFSGEPFSMSETHNGWSMTTVATITVRKNIWREKYPGMP